MDSGGNEVDDHGFFPVESNQDIVLNFNTKNVNNMDAQKKFDHAKGLIAEFTKWVENGSDKAAKIAVLELAKTFVNTFVPNLAPLVNPAIAELIDGINNSPLAGA